MAWLALLMEHLHIVSPAWNPQDSESNTLPGGSGFLDRVFQRIIQTLPGLLQVSLRCHIVLLCHNLLVEVVTNSPVLKGRGPRPYPCMGTTAINFQPCFKVITINLWTQIIYILPNAKYKYSLLISPHFSRYIPLWH